MSGSGFEDCRALVTGGSAGIGRAVALQLSAAGARVMITGRNRDRLEAVAAKAPDQILPLVADMGDPATPARVAAEVAEALGGLTLLVNNAGIQTRLHCTDGDPAETSAQAADEIAINLTGVIGLTLHLLPLLKAERTARIVNVTSALGLAPKRSAPIYCATKAGVQNFTRSLRYQCAAQCPTVSVTDCVMPLVETAMTEANQSGGKIAPDAAARSLLAGVKAGRDEIWVGKTAIFRHIHRLAPGLAYRMLRDG